MTKIKHQGLFLSLFISGLTLGVTSSAMAGEDCVAFNTNTATVQFISGDWKIVDGSHWLFSFGNKKQEAERALQVIKTYQMASSCFVGRPDPSMSYLLTSRSEAPVGQRLPSEDCISFNPQLVEAKYFPAQKTWKMVQGNMWMLDFGTKQQEALEAVQVVKNHQFDQQCFVGRPAASFSYWKKTASANGLADLGLYGFLRVGKLQREVQWNETLTLTPRDAFQVSNGIPAFDIYYADKNYGAQLATGYENQIFLDGQLVSRQFDRSCGPGVTQPVHTQAYLKPSSGIHTLTIKVNATHAVAETRDDNNTFQVKVLFQGF